MYVSARRRRGGATCRHNGIVVGNKSAKATTNFSMGVRGITGTGGLYTVDTLWSADREGYQGWHRSSC